VGCSSWILEITLLKPTIGSTDTKTRTESMRRHRRGIQLGYLLAALLGMAFLLACYDSLPCRNRPIDRLQALHLYSYKGMMIYYVSMMTRVVGVNQRVDELGSSTWQNPFSFNVVVTAIGLIPCRLKFLQLVGHSSGGCRYFGQAFGL
jgi:hypothetical protein